MTTPNTPDPLKDTAPQQDRTPQVKRPISDLQREHLANARRVKRQKKETREQAIDLYLQLNKQKEESERKSRREIEEYLEDKKENVQQPTERKKKSSEDNNRTSYFDTYNVRAATKWGLYLAGTIFVSYMAKQLTGRRDKEPQVDPTMQVDGARIG